MAGKMQPRFRTRQRARLESYQGDSIETWMYDLSLSGAYFEADDFNFRVGDLVRLTVNLPEMNKTHTMSGRVVWTTPQGKFSGQPGLGLKFINSNDIYRDLMSKL